jgi:hypothetical protein
MFYLFVGALSAWLSGVLSVIACANFMKWMNQRD